jgi:phosphoglycolate phosphatase
MRHLALFDCDGTLVDSQANICMAMEQACGAIGIPVPPRSQIRRIVGLSVFEAASALIPDADIAVQTELASQYKTAFHNLRAAGKIDEPLYDGMKELLISLHTAGWQLGVATGKSDRGLALCLAHHGITDLFVTLQTADRHPSKPHPSMIEQAMVDAGSTPQTTVMIGDTSFDIGMGIAAGCKTIGVGWGYHAADELRDAGANMVANTMNELHTHIQGLR